MRKALFILLIIVCNQVQGQKFYSMLNGFKLGQYRDAPKNEFGLPFQSGKYEDGYEYEIYLLKPDSSLYMIFEYAKAKTDIIWSIQLTASIKPVKMSMTDAGFHNAKLGMSKSEVEHLFGKPSSTEDMGEYGQEWSYDSTNFSIEVNDDKLSSIKIIDNNDILYPIPDVRKIPSFEEVKKVLTSGNNESIANILLGDIEIYSGTSTYYFKKSINTEKRTDFSKVFMLIRQLGKDLKSVNTNNIDEYEENARVTSMSGTMHVIKLKKAALLKEIVFKYYDGRYLIYEIRTN